MNSTMLSALDSDRDSIRDSATDAPAQDFIAQPEPRQNKINEEASANALSDPDDIPPLTKQQLRHFVPLRMGETQMERLRYAKALCQARAKWLKRKQARRSEARPSQEARTAKSRRDAYPCASLPKEEHRHD